MSERNTIYDIVKKTEERFGCLCYAFRFSKKDLIWNVGIDDYDLYCSKEFKEWMLNYKSNRMVVFCYCSPNESTLWEYAQNENLIIVI